MEINAGRDVKPISDFRKDSAEILKRLKETRQPVLLTQHGRSVAVLLDVHEYEKLNAQAKKSRSPLYGK